MTPFIKKKDIKKEWYLIDAQNAAVGRLAAFVSKILRGKINLRLILTLIMVILLL